MPSTTELVAGSFRVKHTVPRLRDLVQCACFLSGRSLLSFKTQSGLAEPSRRHVEAPPRPKAEGVPLHAEARRSEARLTHPPAALFLLFRVFNAQGVVVATDREPLLVLTTTGLFSLFFRGTCLFWSAKSILAKRRLRGSQPAILRTMFCELCSARAPQAGEGCLLQNCKANLSNAASLFSCDYN